MAKGIFAALEELGEGQEETVDIIDPGEEAHDENLRRETTDDIEMTSDQIGELTGTIDQTENAVDDLMAIGDSLSTDSEMPGIGIDEVSIKPTMLAVEALYRKLGIQEPILPSLESFSNPRSSKMAVEQLKASIEAKAEEAKSGIKKVVSKVWEFIKKLFEKIMNAFKNMFLPSIKGLIKKLEALKASEPKEKNVKDSRLVKAFGKPGSNVSKGEVKKHIEGIDKLLNVGFESGKSFTIDDLIYDTQIKVDASGPALSGKVSVEVKSGWDGKEPGDHTVELADKSECLEILHALEKVPGFLAKHKTYFLSSLDKVADKQRKAINNDEDVGDDNMKEQIALQKVGPKVISIVGKTATAGIDYCNKSYKEIKANEGGKEEK